jgi:hypothetical protein
LLEQHSSFPKQLRKKAVYRNVLAQQALGWNYFQTWRSVFGIDLLEQHSSFPKQLRK